MKKLFIIIVLVALYPCAKGLWAKFSVAAPELTVSSSAVLVGDVRADHALYAASPVTVMKGTAIDYGFNSFGAGGDFFSKLGGRAMLTSMQTPAYDHMVEQQQATGACMANYLNQNQENGLLSHVVLIPASPEVMNEMRLTKLSEGSHFYMHGRPLTIEQAVVGGNSMNVQGVSYFLVDSFSKS